MTSFQAVVLTGRGGLDKLETKTFPITEPTPNQIRVKVLATASGATDLIMRKGTYIYAPNYPFTIGYVAVGMVDACGAKAQNKFSIGQKVAGLLVHGGCAEYIIRDAEDFVPVVPSGLDDAQVVALILNYVTAYQMIHRFTKLKPGQTALITSAAGGVGLAALELLQILGVQAYAACSQKNFELVKRYGAIPILDSRSGTPVNKTLRKILPKGCDAAFDGIGGRQLWECVWATRRGGSVVGFGFMGAVNKKTGAPANFASIRGILGCYFAKLYGRDGSFYGITALYRKNRTPFREDFAKLCTLLGEGKINPVISKRFPLLAGKEAQEFLEQGGSGTIVLSVDAS